MNTFKNVALLILMAVVVLKAQTPGSGFTFSKDALCGTPGLGLVTFCKPLAGGPFVITDDGVPWPKPSTSAIPATFTCTVTMTPVSVSSTGVVTYTQTSTGCK